MINLLPTYQKKEIIKEKRWKASLVFVFILFLFFLFLSLSFFAVNYLGLPLLEKELELVMDKKAEIPSVTDKEEKIKQFNETISKISLLYDQSLNLTHFFKEIEEIIPEESYITNYLLEKNRVVLSGQSIDWDSLNEIEEIFKNNFSDVQFSPESWTKTKDINFLVSFKK